MERLYTVKEAAKIVGVTPKTLRVWEKEGKIKSLKTIGGHRRYTNAILDDCIIEKPSLKKLIYHLEIILSISKELNLSEYKELNEIINKIIYGYKTTN